MLKRATLLLTLLFTTLSSHAQTNGPAPATYDPLDVVSLQIPWLLDEERRGPYNDVADALLDTFPGGARLTIHPIRRAMRHFFEGSADCFFSGNYNGIYFQAAGITREDLHISIPFNVVNIRAFTRLGAAPVTHTDQLFERRVAVDLGIGGKERVQQIFAGRLNAINSINASQAHALLTGDRVGAVLMMDYDYALYAARNPFKEPLAFSPGLSIEQVEDAVICKKGDRSKALIQHINSRLADLSRDGSLPQLLGIKTGAPTGRMLAGPLAEGAEKPVFAAQKK